MIPDFFQSPEPIAHIGVLKTIIGLIIVLFATFIGVEIKVIALTTTQQVLISQIDEVAAVDIGQPDCKLVNPFWVNPLEGTITLEPFLNSVTKDDTFMMSSDKILTLADPTPTLLEKYQDLINE